jgi:hypothetical protein
VDPIGAASEPLQKYSSLDQLFNYSALNQLVSSDLGWKVLVQGSLKQIDVSFAHKAE